MDEFCNKLPKIELHAHLNGSCSDKTIQKLLVKSGIKHFESQDCKSLTCAFEKFKQLHELCNNNEAIYMITRDVIEDFANENVKYLELRTTPKANIETGMTKNSYIESVLTAIKDSQPCSSGSIIVKLIISIDRGRSLEDAWENLKLAQFYAENKVLVRGDGCAFEDPIVVGIDLSGNPQTNDVAKFIPVLKAAKEAGFKLTVHLAEVPDSFKETESLLSLMPDRIGHATFVLPRYEKFSKLVEFISRHQIPLELCLTSNLKCGTVASVSEHHMSFWMERSHPVAICTDDKGVILTTLSEEYSLASKTFNLPKDCVWALSCKSIDYIFSNDNVKTLLKNYWKNAKSDVFRQKKI